MKKTLLCMSAALMSMMAMATNYNGTLQVSVDGEESSQPATISIDENSGKYTLTLNNFVLVSEETSLPVGNIVLTDVAGGVNGGVTALNTQKDITIAAGDLEGVTADQWMGPLLGEVPVKMSARFNADGYLAVNIDINMATLGQTINVKFNNLDGHYQMPNSDFETWPNTNNAPRHWHGFESVTGSLAGTANNDNKLNSSTDVRKGATGKYCAMVTSTKVLWVVANGTMTNGRLAAGSPSATDAANHSETDLSSTSVDANGDPFATRMYAKPDAVKCWLKFSQGTTTASYPYASFNAVLTDGTYYQDPQDKTYKNVSAVAKPADSLMTVGDWRELNVPFDYASYASNNAETKAILLTISTNKTPGKGSNGDKVYVDDIELVYLAELTSVSYKDEALAFGEGNELEIALSAGETVSASDFAATVKGASALATVSVEETETGYRAVVTAVSGDLMTADTRVVNFVKPQALKGDVNGDGLVNVADVTELVNVILGVSSHTNTDVNNDGTVDVLDVTELVNIVLGN